MLHKHLKFITESSDQRDVIKSRHCSVGILTAVLLMSTADKVLVFLD